MTQQNYYKNKDRYGSELEAFPVATSVVPVYHDGAAWAPAQANAEGTTAWALKLDSSDVPLSSGLVKIKAHGFPIGKTAYLDWAAAGAFVFLDRGQDFYAQTGAPLGTCMQGLFTVMTEDVIELKVSSAFASLNG